MNNTLYTMRFFFNNFIMKEKKTYLYILYISIYRLYLVAQAGPTCFTFKDRGGLKYKVIIGH